MISYADKKLTLNFNQKWERPTWASLKKNLYTLPKERLHYKLFTYFLDNMGTMRASLIKRILPTLKSGTDNFITELVVPRIWQDQLFKDFNAKSVMYGEVRIRISSSDHIIQPSLRTSVTSYSQANDVQISLNPGETEGTNAYSQIVIEKKLKKFRLLNYKSRVGYKNVNSELLESISEQIAKFIDTSIISTSPNTSDTALESILTTEGVFDHVSEGMKTYAGYVDVPGTVYEDGADPLKTCLFHLPQGYRQRSKWMFNSNTGLNIAAMKDGNGNYLIDQRNEALQTVGVPDRLLNKPIVYNEYMPDVGIIGILGDFSRGYVISPSKELTLVIDDIADDLTLKMYIGGKVLQKACFKGYRYIERTEEELAEAREQTRIKREEWKAKYDAEKLEKANKVEEGKEGVDNSGLLEKKSENGADGNNSE